MKRLCTLLAIVFTVGFLCLNTAYAASDWKASYRDILAKESQQHGSFSFIVDDVTGDGIPELFIGSPSENNTAFGLVKIYRYADSKAQLVWELDSFGYGGPTMHKVKDKKTGAIDYYALFKWYSIRAEFLNGSITPLSKVCSTASYDFFEGSIEDYKEFEKQQSNFNNSKEPQSMTVYPLNSDGIALFDAMPANAASLPAAPKSFDTPSVKVNGSEVKFSVEPQIIDGNMYVEMRSLLDNLGYTLEYDSKTKDITAIKGTKRFTITKDERSVSSYCAVYETPNNYNSNMSIAMPLPPVVINSRTMLPLRYMAELFGMDVEWNNISKTASLTSKKSGNGMHYVRVSGVSADNKLMITDFYYAAGKQLESQSPIMVPLEDSKAASIPIKLGAHYAYFNEEPTMVPEADMGKYINRNYIRYYEVNIIDGVIVFFKEVYIA